MSAEYASKHCSELGFMNITDSDSAGKLYKDALAKVADALEADFDSTLLKYSHMTVSDYLSKELGWSHQKINYTWRFNVPTDKRLPKRIDRYFF